MDIQFSIITAAPQCSLLLWTLYQSTILLILSECNNFCQVFSLAGFDVTGRKLKQPHTLLMGLCHWLHGSALQIWASGLWAHDWLGVMSRHKEGVCMRACVCVMHLLKRRWTSITLYYREGFDFWLWTMIAKAMRTFTDSVQVNIDKHE